MIFCVEDDDGIRELMLYTLSVSGFEAKGFARAEDFRNELRTSRPELVLLDVMLPGEDGISLLKWLRAGAETAGIPVIMASAKGTEFDKVIGLDSGADDYLAKPFGMMEMVSRVRAVLRRTGGSKNEVLRIGAIEIDRTAHRVRVSGNEVILTRKEYDLLCILADKPGMVFTRDLLLERVWGMDYTGETRTVDVHIGTLRTKLGEAGELIETVRGVGYRMEDRA